MPNLRSIFAAGALLLAACETSTDPVNLDAGATRNADTAYSSTPARDAAAIAEILGVDSRSTDSGGAAVVDGDTVLQRFSADAEVDDTPVEIEVTDLEVALGGLALAGMDFEETGAPTRAVGFELPSGRRARFVVR